MCFFLFKKWRTLFELSNGGLIFSSSFKYFWARFSISSFIESHGSSTICEMKYKKAPNHFPFSFFKGSDEDLNIYLYLIS